MHDPNDTIAAIATAPGEAGVCIIRISGHDCFRIADTVFSCKGRRPSQRPAGTFVHGRVTDESGQSIDDALLLIMRAPRSYTGEDTVEIQGHGGITNAKRLLRRVLDAGARSAEPGEFTQRAFLNGRIDLMQAEAVLDLIRARSDRAAQAAVEQLDGSLSNRFNAAYDALLRAAADVEATLDFPDDELPPDVLDGLTRRTEIVLRDMKNLICTWDEGHLLREGVSIVIAGRPNVGKSTLMNSLLGRDRSIVFDAPGTTRDIIEEGLILDGVCVKLVDTAGLRDADCIVEQEGVRRARARIASADLHIYVMDASQAVTDDDKAHFLELDPARSILVLNKCDLGDIASHQLNGRYTKIETCLLTGQGLPGLRSNIILKLGGSEVGHVNQNAAISERHRNVLAQSIDEIESAISLMNPASRDDCMPIVSSKLRAALELLGTTTGRIYSSELLDSIFTRFCIGK